MANKKVSQLTSKPSVLTTDLFPIADPSTGQLFKTTISDLGTAIGSGVSSVNTLVGAVVLDTDDIQELVSPTNKWFTDTRARAALSASSPLTYNSGTGAFGIQVATGSQNGYLSSTDWTTFNNKIGTGGGTITGATTFTNTVTLGTASGDNQTLLNLPASTSLIYREGVGSLYGFNVESGVDNSLYLTNTEGGYYQTLYFGDSQGGYNIFGISSSSNAGSTWSARFVVNQNGFVGLNKNNPTEILDVAGNGLFSGSVTASTIVKSGGTSSQFLKADGSVDSSTYALDSAVVKLTGDQTIAGVKTFSNRIVVDTDLVTNNVMFLKNANSNGYGLSIQAGFGTNYALYVANNVGAKAFEVLASGVTNIMGALSGTSATFSGAISGTTGTFTSTITGTRNDNFTNVSAILQNAYINAGNLINFVHNSGGSTTNAFIGHGGDSTGNFVIINNSISAITITRATGATSFASNITGNGFIYASGNIFTGGNNTGLFLTGSTSDFSWGLNRETAGLTLYAGSAASPKMTITTTSRVGIGTTSPSNRLHVSDGTNSTTAIFENPSAATQYIGLKSTAGTLYIGNVSNNMYFETNNAERMRITSGGNLLIGTTSDTSHKLSVSGTTRSTNYNTITGGNDIPALGTATVLTLSSSVAGVYVINANFGPQGNEIYGSAMIVVANSGSFRIVTNGSGTRAVLTMSGANVQITNALGVTLSAVATAILIAN